MAAPNFFLSFVFSPLLLQSVSRWAISCYSNLDQRYHEQTILFDSAAAISQEFESHSIEAVLQGGIAMTWALGAVSQSPEGPTHLLMAVSTCHLFNIKIMTWQINMQLKC